MRGLYIGSFDPFTNGHYDILKQAEQLFDEVQIVIACNKQKQDRFTTDIKVKTITSVTCSPISVSTSLTPDLFTYYDCDYLIRGLRNTSDYLYEEKLLQQYKILLPTIKVIYFRTDLDISSSFVYELYTRNKDISQYVPYNPQLLEV